MLTVLDPVIGSIQSSPVEQSVASPVVDFEGMERINTGRGPTKLISPTKTL